LAYLFLFSANLQRISETAKLLLVNLCFLLKKVKIPIKGNETFDGDNRQFIFE